MATLTQEKKPVIPKLAQDLIAGTIGGWAQVCVGKIEALKQYFIPRFNFSLYL